MHGTMKEMPNPQWRPQDPRDARSRTSAEGASGNEHKGSTREAM